MRLLLVLLGLAAMMVASSRIERKLVYDEVEAEITRESRYRFVSLSAELHNSSGLFSITNCSCVY